MFKLFSRLAPTHGRSVGAWVRAWNVLHDWDDECCRKILSTVAAATPSGSRLVVVEILQQPNTPNPLAPWVDLLMLTQTDGGRQRSADKHAALLTDAGLRPTGTMRHTIPHDLVEAVKT